MFMYLIDIEVVVRAQSPLAGVHTIREHSIADDIEQAQRGILEPTHLAALLSIDAADIESASIAFCGENPFPKLPCALLAYDAKTKRMLPERPNGLSAASLSPITGISPELITESPQA